MLSAVTEVLTQKQENKHPTKNSHFFINNTPLTISYL